MAEEAPCHGCPVSSPEQKVKIAEVMGKTPENTVRYVAYLKCRGNQAVAKEKYSYEGIQTCQDANLLQGGPKMCQYGCLGFGSCKNVCDAGAIDIENGLAVIDKEKCKGCGKCVRVCPRKLIFMAKETIPYVVQCASEDKGKIVKENCEVGCIGCGLCIKQCVYGAIEVKNKVATIDATLCVGCGQCYEKCPSKIIQKL